MEIVMVMVMAIVEVEDDGSPSRESRLYLFFPRENQRFPTPSGFKAISHLD